MSTLNVELENLKPGQRYSYKSWNPDIMFEGTFDRVINRPQYFFTNEVKYVPDPQPNNPNNKRRINEGNSTYTSEYVYPRDISVYTSTKLPGVLNQMINEYGGKSRKNRKSKRRNRKSKRRNRKSKKI